MSAPKWLPDWRDPRHYPDPKAAPLWQWAWEFLRRNTEYQADAIAASNWPAIPGNLEPCTRAVFDKLQQVHANERVSKREKQDWERWEHLQDQQIRMVGTLARKWHLRRGILPNPANANAWDEDDFELPGHLLSSYSARDIRTGKQMPFMGTPKHPDEVSVIFDLTTPIPEQLKAAQRNLQWLKREYVARGWIGTRRLSPANPLNLKVYLQVTDAKSTGVKDAEIAKMLWSRLDNRHPDYRGNRRVIDAEKAAHRLIAGGYLHLRIRPVGN